MPRRRGLACLLVLACGAPPVPGDTPPVPEDTPPPAPSPVPEDTSPAARRDACLAANPAPARYAGLVRAFCSEHAHLGGVGASLAVAEDGALRFTAVVGQRCRGGPPVTVDTAFRVGSLTKLATAALALRVADDGRLDLDAPLPELAEFTDPRAATISPRQILHHTAGLGDPDPRDLGPAWLTALAARPLMTDPGALWSYSNAGYAILGLALERTGGRAYPELLARRLLGPLALAHTTADLRRALDGDTACGHLGRGPTATPLDVRQDLELGAAGATWTIPAGGLVASAPDLVALVLGLLDPARSPLSADARAALLAPGPPTHERHGERQAPGTRVQPLPGGAAVHRLAGHTGDFTADLSFAPDRGHVVVLLANTGDPLRATLLAADHDLLGLEPAPPAPAPPFTAYAGTYAVPGWPAPLTVDPDGTITAPPLALAAAPLTHLGDHRFRVAADPPQLFTFVFTAGPHATHVRARGLVATRTGP